MKDRLLLDIRPSAHGDTSVVDYHAPDSVVTVELSPKDTWQPGRIAGMEGISSELFFDAGGRLRALELSVPAYDLRVCPADELPAPVAAAGALIAHEIPDGPVNARTATFSVPFGTALFAFDGEAPGRDDLVALAPGVTAGISRRTGAPAFVRVEGFDRRQVVLGQPVSVEHQGRAYMDSLNAIHIAFLSGHPGNFADVARPLAAGDELLARLVHEYERMMRPIQHESPAGGG